MLVLSRKSGEAITLADNIIVHVVKIRGGRVQLAIEAPQSVRIDRQEILGQPSVIRTQTATTVCKPRHLHKQSSTSVDAV